MDGDEWKDEVRKAQKPVVRRDPPVDWSFLSDEAVAPGGVFVPAEKPPHVVLTPSLPRSLTPLTDLLRQMAEAKPGDIVVDSFYHMTDPLGKITEPDQLYIGRVTCGSCGWTDIKSKKWLMHQTHCPRCGVEWKHD